MTGFDCRTACGRRNVMVAVLVAAGLSVATLASAQDPAQQPPAPAPAAPAPDPIQQLKDLADLKNQGILTEEEFAAQKAKILGS
jgi:hypothetical protein